MLFGCLGLLIGIILAIAIWLGPLLSTAQKNGFFDPEIKRNYEGDTMTNLKSIHTAIMLYQESEGQLPYAQSWMDATWKRLQTGDMEETEAKKQLRSPSVASANPLGYGYAFNEALSGKHTLDVKDPENTPLVFDSSDISWNAFGNPAQLAPNPPRPEGNYAINIAGTVVKLESILK